MRRVDGWHVDERATTQGGDRMSMAMQQDATMDGLDDALRAEYESRVERLAQVNSARVFWPQWHRTMTAMERCFDLQPYRAKPPCLLVVGPKGCGKSTLAESFKDRHPVEKTAMGTMVPVFYATVPGSATPNQLASELLRGMGEPRYARGNLVALTARLRDYMARCQTRVLILDEIQHFVDAKSKDVVSAGADWLKNLIKDPLVKLSCILVGLEDEANQLVESNKGQLGRFFPDAHELHPLAWGVGQRAEDTEFFQFLEELEALLPFQKRRYLANKDTAWRCYTASEGNISYLMDLVRTAAENAILNGVDYPTRALLAEAFRLDLAGKRRGIGNPFDDDARDFGDAVGADVDADEDAGADGQRGSRSPRSERNTRGSKTLPLRPQTLRGVQNA